MFDNRLMILREETGMSKKDVATALKIPYTTYLNYENDIREPNADTLIKIANLYNVSIDYLLGVSDVKTTNIDIKEIRKTTGLSEKAIINIKKFCINSVFGMVYLNKLLENLDISKDNEPSILYEIILYLHYNTSQTKLPGDFFALYTNNTLQKISFKKEKTSSEIDRVSERELIEQLMINKVIYTLRTIHFE